MWAHIVVIDLIAWNDRRLRLLESTHDLFSVSDLAVESFHLVVVYFAIYVNVFDMLRSVVSCPELFLESFMIGWQPIGYQNLGFLTYSFSADLE